MRMFRGYLAMACLALVATAPTIAVASHDRMTEGIVAVDQTPAIVEVAETAAVLTLISDAPAPVAAPVLRDDLTPAPVRGLFVAAPT